MTDPADTERPDTGVPAGDAAQRDAASHEEQPASGIDASLPQRAEADARVVEP